MNLKLAYGRGQLEVNLPSERTTVIEPAHQPALPDERTAVMEALSHPIGARPLLEQVKPSDRICVLFTDITRATPNERLIPWLLDHLKDHPRENIVLLNQLGTHRPNSRAELEAMLTPEVVRDYRVINHEPENEGALVQLGTTRTGVPALINRHAVEADLRIMTGFIEPHFFAGFSGGPKAIMPGVAGLRTVMSNHGFENIGDERSTFGQTVGNPLWEELMDIAGRTGPKFLLNVTLNDHREITGVFAGDLREAHQRGCEFVRGSAMQKVDTAFDVVVSTNSGYPLDQNLYQGVKGMSAAARILKDDGLLILACECSDGVPNGSPYDSFLRECDSTEELLARIATPGFVRPEQWQSQIQALIQRRARVLVKSGLPSDVLRACHLDSCDDISCAVGEELGRLGPEARVAVLPQGPLTVPYIN